ncbi:MAG: double-stranded DNA-binding protein [Candidatus Nitrosopolaris wilkensis]|nr:MAG: double-stranded DNA-binding protein [Candidatus Nitrosopolaris wilkensis]
MSEEEDRDLTIIKARKMKELQKQAATQEKMKVRKEQESQPRTDMEIISSYLYDRGEEVLDLAKSQFPIQTRAIVRKIVELVKAGEINQRISGGELLALFRSVGMNIRVNTSIRVEDHGKLVSFSDKLKYENEDNTTA